MNTMSKTQTMSKTISKKKTNTMSKTMRKTAADKKKSNMNNIWFIVGSQSYLVLLHTLSNS